MPRRKKQIQNYDFICLFEGDIVQALEDKLQLIRQKLIEKRVIYNVFYVKQDHQTYILLAFNDEDVLFRQAEQLKILKNKDKRSFRLGQEEIYREIKGNMGNEYYQKYLKFLSVRLRNEQICAQEKLSPFNNKKRRQFNAMVEKDTPLFNLDDELKCKYNELLTFKIQSTLQVNQIEVPIVDYPFQQLFEMKSFRQLIPIHKPYDYKIKGKEWYSKSIKEYVGSNIEVYFELVRYLQNWLYFPAAAGIITIFYNLFYDYTAQDSPMDSFYGLFVLLWGVYFVSTWQKNQKWLKVKEKTGYSESWAIHQKMIAKGTFSTQYSLVTGELEDYHPFLQRLYLFGRTWLILTPMIILALLFMIFSLNIRGCIDKNHKLLYWPSVAALAEPGGIFDSRTNYAFIPIIFHAIFINFIDEFVYRPLAIYSTKLQQHLELKKYQNSIILKFFLYEYLITFADLFYIAFVRFDIVGLKEQLVPLFFVDIVRRMVSQTLIPWSMKTFKSKSYKKALSKGSIDQRQALRRQAIIEANKPIYEPFDDYLEIVTNFAYLVMLSSCFPIAPLLILASHFVEVIHDKYKILFIYRRQLPKKYEGIGFWKNLLIALCYMSVATNILLFAFSSQQIVGFFPKLFNASSSVITGKTDFSTFIEQAVLGINQMISNPTQMTKSVSSSMSTTCSADPVSIINPPVFFEMNVIKKPPVQEQQASFVVVLFVIEHICVFAIIWIRKYLQGQKGLAEIFAERRNYKKSIKSRISKESLNQIFESRIVS